MGWNEIISQIKDKGLLKTLLKDFLDNSSWLLMCLAVAGGFYLLGAHHICVSHGGTLSGHGFMGINLECYSIKLPEIYTKYKGMPEINLSLFNWSHNVTARNINST